MLLRRILSVALAAVALVGCQPSVPTENAPSDANPRTVDYVVFDPSTSQIPLPNDLGLLPTSIATQAGAQKELLTLFATQGGYPNDQDVPVTIDVQRVTLKSSTTTAAAPPSGIDPAGLNQGNVLFLEKKAGATTPVPVATPGTPLTSVLDITYGPGAAGDRGTLTFHRKPDAATKSRRWNAGSQYIVLVRGGPNGVKLADGSQLTPMPTLYFLTQGVKNGQEVPGGSLLLESNQYLLPVPAGWTGPAREGRAQTGAQLEALRQGYLQLFGLADQLWGPGGAQDVVSIQTFTIAPAAANQPQVVMDASAGVVPLPSDFLLDPANGGKTIVKNAAFGPLADGIATLDGFSTTAMILSATSLPGQNPPSAIAAASVNKDTVFVYDLSNPAAPARVKEFREVNGPGAGFVAEPSAIAKRPDGTACQTGDTNCVSTAIGLQPAALVSASPVLTVPPLKEGTEYAVLVTDGVQGVTASGATPLKRSTLASILLFENPLFDSASGKATLAGQDPAQSAGLEKMRQGIAVAAAALAAEKNIPKSKIVAAYTFRTQTITSTALKLAALPYQTPTAFVPGPFANVTAGFPPLTGVAEVLTVPLPTVNPIDPTTGALNPDTTKWAPAALNGLLFVPAAPAPNAAACGPVKCAPLVVFGHGLGGNKTQAAGIAGALASAGFVVAAIDAPLHGDRSYCTSDAECVCPTPAGACTAPKCDLFPNVQPGDTVRAGLCGGGSVANLAVAGISGRFAVTGNLFRMRDGFRQMILDTSAVVLALAPPTQGAAPNALQQELGSKGIAIDPRAVYWVGQSLGGLMGTLNLAANPRFSRGVLNVPGATVIDILKNSPTFSPQLAALLTPLGIQPGSPEELQFLQVAKMALDAGDPANFGPHIVKDTLPNLLAGQATPPAQTPKNVFGQFVECDSVIPNSTNLFLLGASGLDPTPTSNPNAFTMYRAGGGTPPSCNPPNANPAHGFLLSPTGDPNATAAGQADAVAYLNSLTVPTTATRP